MSDWSSVVCSSALLWRGSVVLPADTGKSVRVAVFAQGEKAEAAKAAGADIVGMEDLADAIKGGQIDFDILIASPDTMRIVGALGQIQIGRASCRERVCQYL